MSIVVLKLPDVKSEAEGRPQRCPSCQGNTFQRWGGRLRKIRDPQVGYVMVYRYRCCGCRHTFRHYPEGVDAAQQSQRLRKLAALMWVMGLSYRGIEALLAAFRVGMGRMSAWRDEQAWAEQLRKQRRWKPVRVLGLDGAYVRAWGEMRPVLVAVDVGEGQPVAIGYVDEHNPDAVRRFLEPLVQRLGVSVIVTDDLVHYKTVAGKLDLEQQICQFHVRRWVGRTLKELHTRLPTRWQGILEEVKQLLHDLPIEGSRRLFELWKQIDVPRSARDEPRTPVDQLRDLLIRLSEHWDSYRIFDWQPDVPWTNNATEQVIGRMKVRSRTVRGYKTRSGLLAGLMAAGSGMC
jgi:transposase-like protein